MKPKDDREIILFFLCSFLKGVVKLSRKEEVVKRVKKKEKKRDRNNFYTWVSVENFDGWIIRQNFVNIASTCLFLFSFFLFFFFSQKKCLRTVVEEKEIFTFGNVRGTLKRIKLEDYCWHDGEISTRKKIILFSFFRWEKNPKIFPSLRKVGRRNIYSGNKELNRPRR